VAEGSTVLVRGLEPLQRALKRTQGNLPKHVRTELRGIGKYVRDRAKANVRSRSGDLEGSVRTSVTNRSVSVYSNLPYSRVQDQGGKVGRHHATLLKRADVSRYMTRAVSASEGEVRTRLEALLDAIDHDFEE
jgi:phage gpG-like protein